MRSRRSRGGLGQAQRASAMRSGRCSNRRSVEGHGQERTRSVVQCDRLAGGVSGSRGCSANAWGATAGQERSARTAVWRRCWAEWRERGGLRCDTGSGLSGGDAMMQRSGQA